MPKGVKEVSDLRRIGDKPPSGRPELEEVVERCRAIEERGLDPFTLDIDSILSVVRRYFPSWQKPEELSLDAETLYRVASVVRLQSEWLHRRSSSLYMDPLIVGQRLKELSRDELAFAFASAWRPIFELETLTRESLLNAIDYWYSLPLLSDRWPQLSREGPGTGSMNRQEFLGSKLLDEETFQSRLESLHQELKGEAGKDPIQYWDFVTADSFDGTVERSYLASFLISYGWAALQIHPIQGDIFIQPLARTSKARRETKMPTSVVLTISREDWEHRRGKK